MKTQFKIILESRLSAASPCIYKICYTSSIRTLMNRSSERFKRLQHTFTDPTHGIGVRETQLQRGKAHSTGISYCSGKMLQQRKAYGVLY
ncbi:hypothetical protein Nepgr_017415 [Nepenthes gracilis]|uniref:Uncharacterized protein n=1 Tax=Nepenthes gracilis TaxID=150966 RepID=A0AAD3SRE5_NEPGR|nr:hypothetical protein Nepgr_017415 [Nepenthes gracilis]